MYFRKILQSVAVVASIAVFSTHSAQASEASAVELSGSLIGSKLLDDIFPAASNTTRNCRGKTDAAACAELARRCRRNAGGTETCQRRGGGGGSITISCRTKRPLGPVPSRRGHPCYQSAASSISAEGGSQIIISEN
jgi:hypothetical protein